MMSQLMIGQIIILPKPVVQVVEEKTERGQTNDHEELYGICGQRYPADLERIMPSTVHANAQSDIIALALSSLRKYAQPAGEILARVEQSDRQVRTDALLR